MTDPGLEQDAVDRALVQAHLDGDGAAFDTLLRTHRQRLWAVARRTRVNPEAAAAAVLDACVWGFRNAGCYRGDARVTTWLHRIVVNACLDRARRNAVRATVPLPEQPLPDPRDLLGERETGLAVQAALAALPEDQRVAIVLVDLEGLPVDEAAAVLGVPAGTVKSRCSRGRARLALSLGHLRNQPPSAAVPPLEAPHTSEGGTP